MFRIISEETGSTTSRAQFVFGPGTLSQNHGFPQIFESTFLIWLDE